MRGDMGKRVSVHDFRADPMFRRVERVVADLLARGNVVTSVDVLIGMGLLRPDRLNDWRCGRVPYLERVIDCNLTRLSQLLRILRFHAHDLGLMPSATVYNRYGKGPKRRLLFSKSGDARLVSCRQERANVRSQTSVHSPETTTFLRPCAPLAASKGATVASASGSLPLTARERRREG